MYIYTSGGLGKGLFGLSDQNRTVEKYSLGESNKENGDVLGMLGDDSDSSVMTVPDAFAELSDIVNAGTMH